jgi:hypothetical protein
VGYDRRNESNIISKILEDSGRAVHFIEYDQLEEKKSRQLISRSFVINEMSLEEIYTLSDETLSFLSEQDIVNDFRTVVLVHNKSFFVALNDPVLQASVLSEEERALFSRYICRTYGYHNIPISMSEICQQKDEWVMKHPTLGKSKEVYPGLLSQQKDWEDLLSSDRAKSYVFQEWIEQKRFKIQIGQDVFDDYVTGTLLFMNGQYYGPGVFRTSSYPVTNRIDDRKASSLVLDETIDLRDLRNLIFFS